MGATSVRDITERRRRDEEPQLLVELGGALASLDHDDTLRQIVRVVTLRLADFATIFLLDDSGSQMRRAAAASRAPSLAWAAEAMMELPLQGALSHPVLRVVNQQQPLLVELDAALAQSPPHLRALTAVRPRSALIVPLIAVGRCLGAVAMSRQSQRFDAQDASLAETVARRCALYIENARLYRAEQRATRARDEGLQIVAHDLRNPLNAIGLHLQSLRRRGTDPDRWQQPVSSFASLTPGPASRPSTSHTCSSGSGRPTTPTTAAPAWGWPSSEGLSMRTADVSGSRARRAAGPPSASAFRSSQPPDRRGENGGARQ